MESSKKIEKIELTVVEERREFLARCMSALAGITVIGVVAPLVQACEPSQPIAPRVLPGTDQGDGDPNAPPGTPFDVSTLTTNGQALATTVLGPDKMPLLLVRLSGTEYIALSTLCTHERCKVTTQVPINGPISCGCHGSQYNIDGSVKQGPATEPLKKYASTFVAASSKIYVVIA
jgi:Rieske Fe-S protein